MVFFMGCPKPKNVNWGPESLLLQSLLYFKSNWFKNGTSTASFLLDYGSPFGKNMINGDIYITQRTAIEF